MGADFQNMVLKSTPAQEDDEKAKEPQQWEGAGGELKTVLNQRWDNYEGNARVPPLVLPKNEFGSDSSLHQAPAFVKVKSTGEVGRVLRHDPNDAVMAWKLELDDRTDW